jgi:hypothetical protein
MYIVLYHIYLTTECISVSVDNVSAVKLDSYVAGSGRSKKLEEALN